MAGPLTQTQKTSRWRRRFRRYAHWLEHQAALFAGSAGIFSQPLIPPLVASEVLRLTTMTAALSVLGYVNGTPNTGLPITAP